MQTHREQTLYNDESVMYIRNPYGNDNVQNPEPKRGRWVNVRTEEKIKRNEPCPCGSGKKYKKCCLS